MFTSTPVFGKIETLHFEVIPLRKRLSTFFLENWDKGIHNLMLYVAIGNLLVYVISIMDQSGLLIDMLRFDAGRILQGQVWRLITVPFLHIAGTGNSLLAVLFMFSYVWIGRFAEQLWGTLKFTVYYFGGLLLLDIIALFGNCTYLPNNFHMTLFLIFALAAPTAQIRLWGIIPLKAKYLAWFDIIMTAVNLLQSLGIYSAYVSDPSVLIYILMPVVPLVYFLLFVGRDARLLLPDAFTRTQTQKNFRNYQNQQRAKARQHGNSNWAADYRSASGEKPYRHKCTVCGRTDVSNPELDFRYCSKCQGYHCYCMDHINNHAHIQ